MSTVGFKPDGIDGRKWSEAECDRLHFLKNRPDVPTIDGMPLTFPQYEYRPYPAAMYGPWSDDAKRRELLRIAGQLGLNLSKPLEREEVESKLAEHDSRLVGSDAERRDWAAKGWADSPEGVKAAQNAMYDAVAREAAERAYVDRNMTDKSKAEFLAADRANGEDHLVDLPAPKKKPGRPKKQEHANVA
jgi:hypothetical protein